MNKIYNHLFALCLCVSAVNLVGCHKQEIASNRVVLYCSVDDVYAKPIIKDLEKRTGLQIDALYDTEAAKTAGLANKIRAEKNRPQGDVFWSSALLQTLLLHREGLLQPYVSPSAQDIPSAFKAKDGSWSGLGVRPRVVVSPVQSFTWNGPIMKGFPLFPDAISNPQFGTSSDWASALTARQGKTQTLEYFRLLKQKRVQVLPGNSVVAQKVANGQARLGITDSDDYFAQKAKAPEKIFMVVALDNNTVFIPGSVAILKNAPHQANAKKLVDALLQRETEKQLVQAMTGVMPLRPGIEVKQAEMQGMMKQLAKAPNDTEKWPAAWDEIREPLAEILLKD